MERNKNGSNVIVKNRAEILFLYDVSWANPNGDPVDENKPRIDPETGINIVTDARLKRTIRDYWDKYKGLNVFIKEIREPDGSRRTKERRLDDFKDPVSECIDIRVFGATVAVKNKTLTYTGPVQFKFGYSLHKVDLTFVKGTTVMPSGEGKEAGTFTERYVLPYSLIVFYGILNENTAKTQEIPLTKQDVDLLLEAMWLGTKNLSTGSKIGHCPRLLLCVEYKENSFHIGELDRHIKLVSSKEETQIRSPEDFSIDISKLVNVFSENKDKIQKIEYEFDKSIRFVKDGKDISIQEALREFPAEKMNIQK
ncbi:MAG: type I-B CRISPR-associated protein Cas7/Csh2 [Candidatus Calescibacterium sp.]|nr:type I-B CRISPR-associated protein Cas7/Csh2 [Candidatus Calescibacterium sp.]MDW8087431.1 type I-B CRISPR-associated protein Cas7/Csh2 [Candidatus Calescibacterium sp.]